DPRLDVGCAEHAAPTDQGGPRRGARVEHPVQLLRRLPQRLGGLLLGHELRVHLGLLGLFSPGTSGSSGRSTGTHCTTWGLVVRRQWGLVIHGRLWAGW